MASENRHERKRFSALWITLATFLILLVLLIAAGTWLLGTESGARAAFSMLRSMSGGMVQAEGIHGRLSSPIRFDQLRVHTADQRITINNLYVQWRPSELLQRQRLHLERLHAGELSVALQEEKEEEPAQLPDDISLPVLLQADQVRIDRGHIKRGQADLMRLDGAAFSLVFDGEQYRLRLDKLALRAPEQPASASADISGRATLSVTKPYPVNARLTASANTSLQDRMLSTMGDITLNGSLAELAAGFDLAMQQAQISGNAMLQPFSEQVLGTANIRVSQLDLSAFNPELPHTALNGSLSVAKDGSGQLNLANTDAGLYNNAKVPLTNLQISFLQQEQGFVFSRISAVLGTATRPAGKVAGSGRYVDGVLILALDTPELNLQRLDQRFPATQLRGKINIDRTENTQEFTVAFTEPFKKKPLSLTAHATLSDQRLTIDQATLQVGSGQAEFSGYAGLSEQQKFAAKGRISKFRLQDLGDFPQLPRMLLNGRFELSGERAPQLAGELSFQIEESLLAGNRVHGEGRAQLSGEQITVPNLLLVAGENRLTMQGELSERSSALTFSLQAPKLGQLGQSFGGAIVANGRARGTVAKPQVDVTWEATNLRLPNKIQIGHSEGSADVAIDRSKPFSLDAAVIEASARSVQTDAQQLAALSVKAQFGPEPSAPLALTVKAKGLTAGDFRANSLDVSADGTTARHTLKAQVVDPEQNWTLAASGGLRDLASAPAWEGTIDRFNTTGRVAASLEAPAPLTLSQQRVALDGFRLNSEAGTVIVDRLIRDSRGIATSGRITRLQLSQLLKFTSPSPAISTDLQLEGEWDINITDSVDGSVALRRTGGDVIIRSNTPVALGLHTLQATASANNGRIDLELNARGQRLGQIAVNANTRIAGQAGRFSVPPDAPLSGRVSIDVPTIAWAGPMVSATLITEGQLSGDFSLGGTLSDPRLNGRIAGNALRFYSSDLGVDLRNGVLRSEFQGSELLINALRFQNADGQLSIAGPVSFKGGKPNAQLALTAQRFALLNRSDRRLTLSGQSKISLAGGRTSIEGDFTVDSGYFNIGQEGTPHLSNDVVIVGSTKEESEGQITPALNIRVGLGNGVKLEGRGLDAVLVGQIRLQNAAGEPLQAYGTLRVAKGTYAAYGRKLAIDRGVLRFTGPINNPALNILAMRRDQEVEAGVSVQGTVLAPRITLVSEPSVPDAEKLSWLVLGRGLSGVGEGELGSLQDAAASLLSQGAAAGLQSQLANAFGLDTFSVSRSDDTLQQRIITLGKQISSRLYVSYQQGLETANRAILLRYTLSPRLTIEVEAGTRSALSLFYNFTFD